MPAAVEILLWCAALATWVLMILATGFKDIRRRANGFRRRTNAKRTIRR
jgi:hypothetical protein